MNTDLFIPFAADLLLKSSAIIVIAWLILLGWRRASAAQRGCVWCVALVLIALLPFTRLVAPHWALWFSKPTAPVAPALSVVPTESPEVTLNQFLAAPPARTWSMPDAATLALSIWLGGILLLVAYRSAGAMLLRRCHNSSSPLQSEAAQSIATALGITRPIDLRISRACQVPVTWGTRRPVVMLPVEALQWPAEWLEAALRHEMGHVKNCDHLKRLVAFLTCAFYWPNPLVWAAAKQLQLAQEEASDNLVLQVGVTPQDYASQLIEVIRSTAGRSVLSIPVVAMARPSTLEGRLAAILDETRNRENANQRQMFIGTGLAIVVGLTFGAIQLRAADASASLQKTDAPQTAEVLANPPTPESLEIREKLKSISLSLDFNQATIEEATNYLSIESKRLDPQHKGVHFIILAPASASAKPVTLSLENVSLGEALQNICKVAEVKFVVMDHAIVIRAPSTQPDLQPQVTQDGAIARPDNEAGQAIERKLKTIIIDKVKFDKLDIAHALQFFAQKSKEFDPDKKGINFVLHLPDGTTKGSNGSAIHREVTISLDNVPLEELLDFVAQQTNLKWSIEDGAVYLRP